MQDQSDPRQRLDVLRDELDRLRAQIDAAREAAHERRKVPDRRARPRPNPDRRTAA